MFNTTRPGRQFRSAPMAFETRNDENGPVIAGYFAVFNNPTELWHGCIEQVAPGAFNSSLNGDVRALIDHDTRLVIGRTTAGTLSLREDGTGLYGEIKINEHDSDAMNLYARVQRGDVDQCSFGFNIKRETFVDLGGDQYRWEIEEVDPLYEVSVCTFPAYQETGVAARQKELEDIQKRQADAWKQTMKNRIGGK